jgi:hypothetical protein
VHHAGRDLAGTLPYCVEGRAVKVPYVGHANTKFKPGIDGVFPISKFLTKGFFLVAECYLPTVCLVRFFFPLFFGP